MRDVKTSELTSCLIAVGKWTRAPASVLKIVADIEEEYGGNVAIGFHSDFGWFILHDQGYGIALVWKEKDCELELPDIQNTL